MLRKIIEVCKKHLNIIVDIVLAIVAVILAKSFDQDVRMFLVIPVMKLFCDMQFVLLNKKRVWSNLFYFLFGCTLSWLLQTFMY